MGSEQTNSPVLHDRPITPISEMGAWHFWADAYAVGLPLDDAAAIKAGTASQEQLERARVHGQAAMNALISAEGPQHRGWPLWRPS